MSRVQGPRTTVGLDRMELHEVSILPHTSSLKGFSVTRSDDSLLPKQAKTGGLPLQGRRTNARPVCAFFPSKVSVRFGVSLVQKTACFVQVLEAKIAT